MPKRTRIELKNVFKTGAKPTGLDFSDLIDSVINLEDDGIEKQPELHKPLKIMSNGDHQNLLDFYDQSGLHTWRLNQYPDDINAGVQRAGFNITSANGDTRLFIKQDDGNVGIANPDPQAKLHVIMEDAQGDALRVDDVGVINGEHDPTPFVIKGDGRVGIGIEQPEPDSKLHVVGQVKVEGPVNIELDDNESFEITNNNENVVFSVTSEGTVDIGKDLGVTGNLTVAQDATINGNTILGSRDEATHDGKTVTIAGQLTSDSNELLLDDNLKVTHSIKVGDNDNVVVNKFSTDGTLGGNSNSTLPTESAVKTYIDNRLPAGVIVMWSGSADQVPESWALCDGKKNTPNLSGRFVLGYDENNNDYSVNQSGGASAIELIEQHLPAHNHGEHDHDIKWDSEDGKHFHQIDGDKRKGNPNEKNSQNPALNYCDYKECHGKTCTDGAHKHSISIMPHSLDYFGGDNSNNRETVAHDNMPPYYVLCYIMKL